MSTELDDLELFFESDEAPGTPEVDDNDTEPANDENIDDTTEQSTEDTADEFPVEAPADNTETDIETSEPDEVLQTNFDILKEKGFVFLPEDYEFEATEEGWNDMLATSHQNLQQSLLNDLLTELPDEGKKLLNFYLEGGRDIESYMKIASDEDFSVDVDSDDNDFKKRAIEKYYKETTKFSDEKIQRSVRELELEGELDSEFEEARTFFVDAKAEKLKQKAEFDKNESIRKRKEAEDSIKLVSNTIKSSKDVYGLPISDRDSTLVINSLFKQVKIDGRETTSFNEKLAAALNDPKKIVFLAKLLESDFDFSPISKKKSVEATMSVKEKLQTALNTKRTGGSTSRSKNDFDMDTASPLI